MSNDNMGGLDTFDVGYAAAKSELTARITELETANKGLQIALLDANEKEKELQLRNAMLVDELKRARKLLGGEVVDSSAEFFSPSVSVIDMTLSAASDDCESFIQAEIVKRLGEPVAHMYPSDLERFQEQETFAQAFSVAVGNPDEISAPLYRLPITEERKD